MVEKKFLGLGFLTNISTLTHTVCLILQIIIAFNDVLLLMVVYGLSDIANYDCFQWCFITNGGI